MKMWDQGCPDASTIDCLGSCVLNFGSKEKPGNAAFGGSRITGDEQQRIHQYLRMPCYWSKRSPSKPDVLEEFGSRTRRAPQYRRRQHETDQKKRLLPESPRSRIRRAVQALATPAVEKACSSGREASKDIKISASSYRPLEDVGKGIKRLSQSPSSLCLGTAQQLIVMAYQGLTEGRCLADLRAADPRDDKKRIEDTNGGLLKDLLKPQRWKVAIVFVSRQQGTIKRIRDVGKQLLD
ncbi:hypothetical protein B0I37DRAFT_348668 [Chaetomium sp. MPI-CAGE-AT-0009]|nr:hypothetical protein B0I37DRAFT_348668 [Chaetomium sp. MPI-CAGE-AT-0009]